MKDNCQGFAGNIEGRDILKGKVDIVVCDGFVGNIILKFAESIMGVLMLAAGRGSTVTIQAEGIDSEEAVNALVALIETGFNEE